MGLPGMWIAWQTAEQMIMPVPPTAVPMGLIGILALAANLFCAFLLVRFRHGDSNVRSAWLSSRNDAIANIAIVVAAALVRMTATPWPDIVAGLGIAWMNLHAAYMVIRQAARELRPV